MHERSFEAVVDVIPSDANGCTRGKHEACREGAHSTQQHRTGTCAWLAFASEAAHRFDSRVAHVPRRTQ